MRASVERDVASGLEDPLELTHHLVDVLELVKHTDVTYVREHLDNNKHEYSDQTKKLEDYVAGPFITFSVLFDATYTTFCL